MKRMKYYIIAILALQFLFIMSCDYLDIVPKEIDTEEDIWSDIKNAEKVLGNLYWTMYFDARGTDGMKRESFESCLGACTDELLNHWENRLEKTLYNTGGWGPTNNPLGEWSFLFKFIRNATVFINNIEKVPLHGSNEATYQGRVKEYKEEARFFRAFFYFELLRQYGAVPLLKGDEDINLNDLESAKLPRSSVDEIVEYISKELDIAASVLPDKYNEQDYGRITKGACLFLKARTLLYAASPLFNGNPMYAGVKNNDGKALFSTNYSKDKWKLAADAAEAVISWQGNGDIEMFQPNSANPIDSYAKLFYRNSENKEIILPLILGASQGLDKTCNPNAPDYSGQGKFSALQGMIDAYETADGHLPFKMNDDGVIIYDENGKPEIIAPGYSEEGYWSGQLYDGSSWINVSGVSNMYKNRDPRFYASINFQSCPWKYSMVNRTLHYAYWLNPSNTNIDGWPKSGTNPETGYNIRKYLDPAINLKLSYSILHNYPLFRLAEMYLTKAEALNEYLDAPNQEVYDAINEVRERVGMPLLPITEEDRTKIGMRKRIRNEKRVEFFMESHRFWDVRRWLIGEQVDNGKVYGLNARPSVEELNEAAAANGLNMNSAPHRKNAGILVFHKRVVNMTRVFEPKHYLYPIPANEIAKNPNLVQNYGWNL